MITGGRVHARARQGLPAPPGRGRWRLRARLGMALLFTLPALAACERAPAPAPIPAATPKPAEAPASPLPPASPRSASSQSQEAPVVLFLGDSLTAGFGLSLEQSYPSLLQKRLEAEGYPHRVVNAGVSGDTSAGGVARLDWLLRQRVDVMVVALGGNDGLRGQSTEALERNLGQIIERVQGRGIQVLLAGMRMPANYGADYTQRFAAVYPRLAKQYRVALLPFLLEGVAADPRLNQGDGIHPNALGAQKVADTVWNSLKPLL